MPLLLATETDIQFPSLPRGVALLIVVASVLVIVLVLFLTRRRRP